MLRTAFAITLLAAASCAPAPASHAPGGPPSGRVVVTVVVDQLAAWVAAERWPLLPPSGGFARLRREGTWVTAMRYEHAVTDTAPGHSALYTGAVPRRSGIFANEVLAADDHPVSILFDPSTRALTSSGPSAHPSSSLAALHVETLADRLRAERPGAFIASLSLKDRGALFAGGRHPDASLWLDTHDNRFVTSSALASAFPVWARQVDGVVANAEHASWALLDAAWVASHALTPDDEAGEGDLPGFGTVFPHDLARVERPALAFRTSPFADEVLLDLALTAATVAGTRDTLIAVSLSANDYIGHTFGPDSWEAWDELERLDAALARFLAGLDRRFGPDGYAVLLTADHGTTPMPEVGRHPYCDVPDRWKRACGPGHRVFPQELAMGLEMASEAAIGAGHWVAGVSDPLVYLTPPARELGPSRAAALHQALETALRSTPGVAEVYDLHSLPAECPSWDDESIAALVCRSVDPAAVTRGALFYVVLAPGSFFDPTVIAGKGTSHGSPYLDDRTVPLLVRAPGRVAAGRVVDSATFNLFADTAASLLGIAPPVDGVAAPPLGL